MKVVQTTTFKRNIKKLHASQKKDVDAAVSALMKDLACGEAKIGDLTGVQVFKFRMAKQLTLLAYSFDAKAKTLTLLALGAHENFLSRS